MWLGMAGLVFCTLFWAATHLIEGKGVVAPELLTAFGLLLGGGQVAQALQISRDLPKPEEGQNPPPGRQDSPSG